MHGKEQLLIISRRYLERVDELKARHRWANGLLDRISGQWLVDFKDLREEYITLLGFDRTDWTRQRSDQILIDVPYYESVFKTDREVSAYDLRDALFGIK